MRVYATVITVVLTMVIFAKASGVKPDPRMVFVGWFLGTIFVAVVSRIKSFSMAEEMKNRSRDHLQTGAALCCVLAICFAWVAFVEHSAEAVETKIIILVMVATFLIACSCGIVGLVLHLSSPRVESNRPA